MAYNACIHRCQWYVHAESDYGCSCECLIANIIVLLVRAYKHLETDYIPCYKCSVCIIDLPNVCGLKSTHPLLRGRSIEHGHLIMSHGRPESEGLQFTVVASEQCNNDMSSIVLQNHCYCLRSFGKDPIMICPYFNFGNAARLTTYIMSHKSFWDWLYSAGGIKQTTLIHVQYI